MAKKMFTSFAYKEPNPKKSSSSGNASMIKTASMNQHKRRSYKAYRGQGK